MKLLTSIALGATFFAIGIIAASAQPAAPGGPQPVVATPVATTPVYVPDYTHAGEPLPDGILAWDDVSKATETTNGQDFARFIFSFTNIATVLDRAFVTNVTQIPHITSVTNTVFFWFKKISYATNITAITNATWVTNGMKPIPVTILSVHPSCGCTTAELPPVPWQIAPGSNGQIKLAVNLQGKMGVLFKTVNVTTDKGKKDLMLRITVPPPVVVQLTEAERARGVAMAKVDRQAVFKGDCVSCHAKNVEGKYGQQLFAEVCAVCHEANPRASMVPDLHNLPVPTSEEFWRTWITAGKAGTLMPAFATSQGGPLNDMQIASLAAYLNAVIPPRAPVPAPVPAPAK
jgi:mono/diheme cytochrome c family protein